MRCRACDCELSDLEATRKYASTGEYIDLCNKDFSYIKDTIQVIENPKYAVKVQPNDEDLI